jgi:hypothetical protein
MQQDDTVGGGGGFRFGWSGHVFLVWKQGHFEKIILTANNRE